SRLVEQLSCDFSPVREGKEEGRTLTRTAFNPDPSAVPLHDLLADRQPDTCPGILCAAVQTLEDHEDALGVLGLDANAVVLYGEAPGRTVSLGADAHHGRPFPAKLYGIANEVLEELAQLHRVSHDDGKRPAGDRSSCLLDCY